MEHRIRNLSGYNYIETTYEYIKDKTIIDSIISKAANTSNIANPHGPDGRYRQKDVRFNKTLGGYLAENALLNYMSMRARRFNIAFKVIDSTFTQEADLSKLGFNQIDIDLLVKDEVKTIEVRSSYSYKTTFNRLIGVPLIHGKGAFSIIGWYTSKNKQQEVRKDYYVFAIHRYYPSETHENVLNKVVLFIAGAANKDTLENKGYNDSLKQEGAKFRIINPLNSVPDPVHVIDEILGVR